MYKPMNQSLACAVACIVMGITFVVSMAIADFETETKILFSATLLLLALSLAVFFFPLRIIAPMFVLIPFLMIVTGRHVGDMGPMHYIDGGIYLMGCFAFFTAIVTATIAKTVVYHIQQQRGG